MKDSYSQWWVETLLLMVNEDRVYDGVEPPLITDYKKQNKNQGIPFWFPVKF